MPFDTLPGFREFYPGACARRNHLFRVWRNTARAFNFSEYDTPVLEPLELYIEKSGEEVVGQLFNFEDRGGRAVAMRPETTPSLARLVGARANSLKRPVKWFTIGEQYRYERPQKGRLRAFHQFNADILGEPGPAADAELILLCIQSLRAFGLTAADFSIRLSDRDLWLLLLEAHGVAADAVAAVLGVVDKRERMEPAKLRQQLEGLAGADAGDLLEAIDAMAAIRDLGALEAFLAGAAAADELAARVNSRLADWRELLQVIEQAGASPFVRIDLGIVRGLAYYTGFVFEAFESSGRSRALAGGGRYDHLVRRLGGPDMPATGFAIGDVTLTDLLEEKGLLPDYLPVIDLVMIIGGEAERPAAIEDAARLRAIGCQVDYPLKSSGFGKQFKQAGQAGARFGLIYGSDELARKAVKVRDFTTGAEREIPRAALTDSIHEILAGNGFAVS